MLRSLLILSIALFCLQANAQSNGQWSGEIGLQYRGFAEDGLQQQEKSNLSVSLLPEWSYVSDSRKHTIDFKPFIRIDEHDDERTHADIRELSWIFAANSWEFRAGIRKVFWGVTESQHLVDIVNQTDTLERSDGEAKLGQPMLNFAWIGNHGTLDFIVMPYFRERTFAGRDGRLRTELVVDTDNPVYESSKEEKHIDYALRWANTYGIWDIGLSFFDGTSREPLFLLNQQANALLPFYEQIEQWGADIQATTDAWLWKLEAIKRDSAQQDFVAITAGFEYTFFNIAKKGADIGIVAEYLYDERDEAPFQDDFFAGVRFALNDVQSSEFLAGCIVDNDDDGTLCSLEASRRFGDSWVIDIQARTFSGLSQQSPLSSFRDEDYIELNFNYFF